MSGPINEPKMDGAAIERAVDILIEAREAVATFSGFPEDCRPAHPGDGYAIQKALTERTGWPVAGWKLGATDADIQRMFATGEPFYGPVYVAGLKDSPAVVSAAQFQTLGLECEFAFSLAREIAPAGRRLSEDEVAGAVHTVIPAIEIISPRLDHLTRYGVAAAIADGALHGGLVLGHDVHDWRGRDLAGQTVRLRMDGQETTRGEGRQVLGGPLTALTWFVNRFLEANAALPAGTVIATGTCTGVTYVKAGQEALADFGDLGTVQISVTA